MNKGFTLIELTIVLAIISILAAIAYPQYNNYLTRARRIEGQSALLDLANRMEHYFSENNTYKTATIATGKASDVLSNPISGEGWYRLSIINATDSAYTLQATPLKAQAANDTACQLLTLNQLGVKGIARSPTDARIGPTTGC